MQSTIFGSTNKKVFRIGLGTYGYGDAYGKMKKENAFKILGSVIKNVSNDAYLLIDTAPYYGYGKCEKWIGKILKKYKNKKILVATKGGRHIEANKINEKDFSADFMNADLEKSLKRLRINKIFLYQLHNPGLKVITNGHIFDWLEKMRNKKKINFYGVSIDDPFEGIAAIDICRQKHYNGLASIQIIYNILNKKNYDLLFEKAKKFGSSRKKYTS